MTPHYEVPTKLAVDWDALAEMALTIPAFTLPMTLAEVKPLYLRLKNSTGRRLKINQVAEGVRLELTNHPIKCRKGTKGTII